jgi:uncharacterized membrane protein
MKKIVPIKDSIRWGWFVFKNNLGFLIGTTLLLFIIGAAGGISGQYFEGQDSSVLSGIVLTLILLALSLLLQMGIIKTYLMLSDSQKPTLGDLFSQKHLFFKYLFTIILYRIIVLVGLLLLVVPGIIWSLKFMYAEVLVIERGYGASEALRKSGEITKGAKWNLFAFNVVQGLIVIAGFIVFGIGLLVAIPLCTIANLYVYRHLLNQSEAPQTVQA